MVRGWVCDRCNRVHTQNPSECRSCGHHILRPADQADLEAASSGIESPEPMDLSESRELGTPSEEESVTGPDLNPDGSLKSGTETPSPYPDSDEETPSKKWRYAAVLGIVLLTTALVAGLLLVSGSI